MSVKGTGQISTVVRQIKMEISFRTVGAVLMIFGRIERNLF